MYLRMLVLQHQKEKKFISLLITLAVGVMIWSIGAPQGLDEKAWHLFAIFVATIIGLIIKPSQQERHPS
ncbi:anion permease [Peribacillus asahii]|uniref:anion permease n=1 Tax=Peribacillus asahii TaxID=228899 RepID=UPI0037F319A4